MNSKNPLQKIKTALGMMAAFRGAKPDANQITLYSNRLVREIAAGRILEDVIAAIEKIADLEREEGEPTFPPVSKIMCMVPVMAIARQNRRSLEQDLALVMWRCEVCGYEAGGWLTQLDSPFRTCPSRLGPLLPADAPRINGQRPQRMQLGQDQRCGAELQVVCDERRTQGA
jgi:hypothetical protein